MIRLRSFEHRDLAELHRLDRICFPPGIAYSKAELKYFLVHPRCLCFIAEQRRPPGQIAGFVIMERATRNGRPVGHIITLDVDPSQRRQGLGTLLMQAAEEQSQRDGAVLMTLEVAEDNAPARRFYRSLGFVACGRIANYYGGRIDAEVMEKAVGSLPYHRPA